METLSSVLNLQKEKCFSPNQKKNISNVLSNIESTFETEIVLIAKIEQLTKQKLFPSRKLNLEGKSTGDANEKASLKNIQILSGTVHITSVTQ